MFLSAFFECIMLWVCWGCVLYCAVERVRGVVQFVMVVYNSVVLGVTECVTDCEICCPVRCCDVTSFQCLVVCVTLVC